MLRIPVRPAAFILLVILHTLPAKAQITPGYLFQVGIQDGNLREFVPYTGSFSGEPFFIAGRSSSEDTWPWFQPGPEDAWAGSKKHAYTILFGMSGKATTEASLNLRLLDIGHYDVKLKLVLNETEFHVTLPRGSATAITGDVTGGTRYKVDIPIPASALKTGNNQLVITNEAGSWFIYDWIGMTLPTGASIAKVQSVITLDNIKALPFIATRGKKSVQFEQLELLNTGDSTDVELRVNGLPPQRVPLATGRREVQLQVSEVSKDSTVELVIAQKGKIITRRVINLQPVKHMTVYILPHSHNDIGYTEMQSAVEEKQMNNLLTGIDFAKRTKDYPAGARYVWNLEGSYVADLFLHRMNEKQQADLLNAIETGGVALNGMYVNTLTGLCRPEELLNLFSFSKELAAKTNTTMDAAMISDVPGYTWGTVTAMSDAGIKYFSVAPNYFDRIGNILVQWENNPFYWVSPSGNQKVLVWIPYMGYALSHVYTRLDPDFVTLYANKLIEAKYPYDISYVRWSGHGDNAVPEIEVSEFVKQFNETYDWPKFIISSTSSAFHAFEDRYGKDLPSFKGDWTGYWEDGSGSSAFETSQNRTSSSGLTQEEALWAMIDPAKFPADKFKAAWRNVILYSEHTWGAYLSVSAPLDPLTIAQWKVKKSYADTADALASELLYKDMLKHDSVIHKDRSGDTIKIDSVDIFNTNSWTRTGLVQLSIEQSGAGDHVTDSKGNAITSQRLSGKELAFVVKDLAPFSARRFYITKGKALNNAPRPSASPLDNGIIRIGIDTLTGSISSFRSTISGNNLIDSVNGRYANAYSFMRGSDTSNASGSGKPLITVTEQGPVLSVVRLISSAPGCRSLTRDIRLINGFDFAEVTNKLDKEPAPLNPRPGDYAWADTGGKESVSFGYPFAVPGGQLKVDIPLAVMRPELDQIPGSCKNWIEVGQWADVSNDHEGITWVTLDAPLLQVGGLTANLLGGQKDPAAWRKKIEPTQRIYSWALNNHWETNYRASQEGIITFRYALRPHRDFNQGDATKFATGLTQPMVALPARDVELRNSLFTLSDPAIIVIALRPADDGKTLLVTLFNPTGKEASTRLISGSSEPGLNRLVIRNVSEQIIEGAITLASLGLMTIRVQP